MWSVSGVIWGGNGRAVANWETNGEEVTLDGPDMRSIAVYSLTSDAALRSLFITAAAMSSESSMPSINITSAPL